jgi:hypothetical protein
MIVLCTQPDAETLAVARWIDRRAGLLRRARAGELAAVHQLDSERIASIQRWRQRAERAEAELLQTRRGGREGAAA